MLTKVEQLPPDRLGVNVSVDEDALHVCDWADRLQPHRLPDAGRRLVEDKPDGHSSNFRRYSYQKKCLSLIFKLSTSLTKRIFIAGVKKKEYFWVILYFNPFSYPGKAEYDLQTSCIQKFY